VCVRKGCQRQSLKPPSSAAFCEGNPAPGTAQGANCLTCFACTQESSFDLAPLNLTTWAVATRFEGRIVLKFARLH
jgi:hypothetical protein